MDCSGLRDDLLDVLYGEAGAAGRRRVETHVTTCPACRDELAALRAVRSDLQRWKAPEARPIPFRRRSAFEAPPYLAAAAALVLASVAALGLWGSEVRYEQGRFRLRFGRGGSEAELRESLATQAARQESEIASLRAEIVELRAAGTAGEGLTQLVSQMIRESEARQTRRLETGLSGVAERTEARRRYDMARIGAGLAYIDGKNGQQFSRTAELVGHVLEASQKRGER
jgi:anti-sigma factor RsiW